MSSRWSTEEDGHMKCEASLMATVHSLVAGLKDMASSTFRVLFPSIAKKWRKRPTVLEYGGEYGQISLCPQHAVFSLLTSENKRLEQNLEMSSSVAVPHHRQRGPDTSLE